MDELFEELKERGLREVKLEISDGHKWIEEAVKKVIHRKQLANVSCTFCKRCTKKSTEKES